MIALAVKKSKTRKRYSQMAGADGVAKLCAAGALLKKQIGACPLRGGFCALRARWLYFILVWAACEAGRRNFCCKASRENKAGLVL